MKIRDIMTLNPQTIGARDVLTVADEKMRQGHFRRLPVVDDDGHLIGITTDRDLRPHVGYLATTRVTSAITECPITIAADAPVEEAARRMLDHKIGGLPVLKGGKLVGIVTESDLLRVFLRAADPVADPADSTPPEAYCAPAS